jgi:hypothetical protein
VAYFIRILTPSELAPDVSALRTAFAEGGFAATVTVETGTEAEWTQLELALADGTPVAAIERDGAGTSDLVAEEIEEFLEEIEDCKPVSAARWLAEYLPGVRTIYAFQVLAGVDEPTGWEVLGAAKNALFSAVGGIIQADDEGFTDEAGYHILWQFPKSVTGSWWMSVRQDGEWVRFQMDLGNRRQRAAFLRGEVPEDAEPVEDP